MSEFRKILFLDRDGTLIEEPADHQIDTLEKFRLLPDVIPSLLRFRAAGYRFVMVSNQDGLGGPTYSKESFERVQKLLLDVLSSQGIEWESVRICPHRQEDHCLCRKPGIGLVQDYLADPFWDRARSLMIGDRETDLELAANMRIEGLRVGAEGSTWPELAQRVLSRPRLGVCERNTRETRVRVEVNLDGTGQTEISTGLGFFDHMLDQIGRHGAMDLKIHVQGDLRTDDHHTIEDTGLALGTAIRSALGDKIGIGRFGFVLPMDETLAQVAIDLSDRPFCRFDAKFDRESVNGLATEMVPHFFRSLADGLRANLHIRTDGENTHHRIEAAFKATGRALRMAVVRGDTPGVPSTKGVL